MKNQHILRHEDTYVYTRATFPVVVVVAVKAGWFYFYSLHDTTIAIANVVQCLYRPIYVLHT